MACLLKLEPILKKTLSEGYLINIIQGSQGITLILLEDYLEEVENLIGKDNIVRITKIWLKYLLRALKI